LEEKIDAVKAGLFADLGAVEGDPRKESNALREVKLVVKGGTLYKRPCAVNQAAHPTYKKSEVSRFHVDPGDCRSTKERCEWRFTWVSSYHSDFNYDFYVSFLPEEIAAARVTAWKTSWATACTSPTTRVNLP
jgi:hypothetical protein